ncbi:hypothetical protein PL75_02325 [Neisseria arctica]|uniref:Lipoprotein n=1 Tax=Neisseria arctica TaxID=1470200 RepID=A0A0J0YTJ4_9NEIS|nr:hypothetical protein [Neisseria arctica]KLT73434.1 hypothetical protein PL75_02325 [Neisseria arctica]UOO86091.1 hypothetical protein LVJ86_07630 [Neisseria arctica]
MKKAALILLLSVFVSGCDLGFPKMYVNYDNLPEGEIKESITKTFPTPPRDEELRNLVLSRLKGNKTAENIQTIVSKMGMTCQVEKDICEYDGYVLTRATGLSSGSGRAKHIYQITISPQSGVDSLKVNKQISKDTEDTKKEN